MLHPSPRHAPISAFATGAFLLLTTASILGCGLFDEEDAGLTYDADVDFEVPISADALCPEGADCTSASVESDVERELDPIEFDVDVDVVQASGISDLSSYSGKFKSVSIKEIRYDVPVNTFTIDIPELTLYVGPLGSEETTAQGVVELATLPTIAAGERVDGALATIATANTSTHSDLLKSLQLAALARAQPKVKPGQPFPPSGQAPITITIVVEFVANPLDALD